MSGELFALWVMEEAASTLQQEGNPMPGQEVGVAPRSDRSMAHGHLGSPRPSSDAAWLPRPCHVLPRCTTEHSEQEVLSRIKSGPSELLQRDR